MSCFKPSNFVRTFESRNFSFNARVSSAICVCLGIFTRSKKIEARKNAKGKFRGRRLSFSRAERGKRTLARAVNSSRKFDNWNWRERDPREKIDQNSLSVSVSLSVSLSRKRVSLFWWSKRRKRRKRATNLRVVDELGVAVAGGDGHVVVVVVVVVVAFFFLSSKTETTPTKYLGCQFASHDAHRAPRKEQT